MTSQIRGWSRIVACAAAETFAPPFGEFLFLRHGETPRNALRLYQEPDEPLSEVGLAQARRAAQVLGPAGIGSIVASPMNRAATTAGIVAEACGLAPTWDPDFRERLFTALWGTSSADMDWAQDPQGCETLTEFVSRVGRGTRKAMREHRGSGRLLIVAHGGVLLALAAMLRVTPNEAMRANAQPIAFREQDGAWQARLLDAGARRAAGEV